MPARLRDSLSATALAWFEARGLALPDIAILQPADPFLDTAGEALRRRIFLTEGEAGESLCLRPEFTIPVCLHHISAHAETPARYAYCGPVFRQHRDGATEFPQAGIEDLGDPDTARADARCLADALSLAAALDRAARLRVVLGDEALFSALIAALDLAPVWRTRLTRFFGDRAKLDLAIASMAGGAGETVPFDGLDRAQIVARIEAEMDEGGFLDAGGRTPGEIADRIVEKRALAGAGLSTKAHAALTDFLAIETRLVDAPAALDAFAARHGVDFGAARDGFAARMAAFAEAGIDAGTVTFQAAFGRPLDYYSAMQFEVSGAAPQPLVGGGRYDHLLTLLGAARETPGVGFSLWLDRVGGER